MKEVGLVFEGREHSGIEDARNTARLVRPIHILANPLFFFIQVWKMVSDGCLLEQTGRTETEREKLQHQLAHRNPTAGAKRRWQGPAKTMLTGVKIRAPGSSDFPAEAAADGKKAGADVTDV